MSHALRFPMQWCLLEHLARYEVAGAFAGAMAGLTSCTASMRAQFTSPAAHDVQVGGTARSAGRWKQPWHGIANLSPGIGAAPPRQAGAGHSSLPAELLATLPPC